MHTIIWHTPQPLWKRALADPSPHRRFRQPTLLRFATDTFMDDVQATLAAAPATLADLVAREESWRAGAAGWSPVSEAEDIVKLYQPVHGRFYLVSASLVCQRRGLPDRGVDAAAEEAASFVLRRLPLGANGQPLAESTPGYREYGWFGTGRWQPVDGPAGLDRAPTGNGSAPAPAREERLPLFPLAFADDDFGHTRRLLAGFIPVAGREAYEAAPRADAPAPVPDPDDPLRDPRLGDYGREVLYALLAVHDRITPPSPGLTDAEVREPFAFGLLDLMLFLDRYFPAVREAIQEGSGAGLPTPLANIFTSISTLESHGVSLAVLSSIYEARARFEAGDVDLSEGATPGDGLNPLAALTRATIDAGLVGAGSLRIDDEQYQNGASLNTRIRAALGPFTGEYETREPEANLEVAGRIGADVGAVYAVRCVFERPKCRRYGRFPVVSERSRPFRLAPFFDSDAPVRPIRVTLPVDTSIAGLRAFPKAVSFLVSDQLRSQLARVEGIKMQALEDGEIGEEGGWTLGMICSLSIPIITICAFILLLILVFVLNIVFWWIPFFRICLPIPVRK